MFATNTALLNDSYSGRDRSVAFGVWGVEEEQPVRTRAPPVATATNPRQPARRTAGHARNRPTPFITTNVTTERHGLTEAELPT